MVSEYICPIQVTFGQFREFGLSPQIKPRLSSVGSDRQASAQDFESASVTKRCVYYRSFVMWKLPEGMEQWKKELEEWLNRGIEFINQIPPTQLYIACAILLLTTALLLLRESH